MTKKEKVECEIEKIEKEIERLKSILNKVDGESIEVCPDCKTKNRHWYASDCWCCAFC